MLTTITKKLEVELIPLLELSVQRKASDIHLTPGQPPIFRIAGELITITEFPVLNADHTFTFFNAILDETQQKEFAIHLELDFAFTLPLLGNFRINLFKENNGVSGVIRVIPLEIPSLDHLGAPTIIKNLLNLSAGIILVTGPTGCGKTTTLAAMLQYINQNQQSHVITIEDPIEYIHHSEKSLMHQRQVYRDTHSFSAALRSALREDPDIILVGEMRDLETIRLALTAAETGHLVMATLHTSSAPRAISRIIDAFPAGEKSIIRNLISESLQAVICQRLVKKIGGGRVAAFEIMLGTPAIRNLIREDKTAQMYSVLQTSRHLGMCTMQQSLEQLIRNKMITQDAVNQAGFQSDVSDICDIAC